MLDRTDADMTGIAHTAATACVPPVLCGEATGSLYIAKKTREAHREKTSKTLFIQQNNLFRILKGIPFGMPFFCA